MNQTNLLLNWGQNVHELIGISDGGGGGLRGGGFMTSPCSPPPPPTKKNNIIYIYNWAVFGKHNYSEISRLELFVVVIVFFWKYLSSVHWSLLRMHERPRLLEKQLIFRKTGEKEKTCKLSWVFVYMHTRKHTVHQRTPCTNRIHLTWNMHSHEIVKYCTNAFRCPYLFHISRMHISTA